MTDTNVYYTLQTCGGIRKAWILTGGVGSYEGGGFNLHSVSACFEQLGKVLNKCEALEMPDPRTHLSL